MQSVIRPDTYKVDEGDENLKSKASEIQKSDRGKTTVIIQVSPAIAKGHNSH